MDTNKAIQNCTNTCMKCLSEGVMVEIEVGALGYGGGFDGWSTKVILCKDCHSQTNPDWWGLQVIGDGYCEEYEHEDEIFEYINSMPLAGQELFHNRLAIGWNTHTMEPQDWIDYQLDILPHEKCKEYHMYSPQEKQAYKDRFPTCNRVYKRVYHDGSSGCLCHRNAHGDADGGCGLNYSTECYLCTDYTPKKGDMRVENVSEGFFKRECGRLQEMISYATSRLELINAGPNEYYDKHGND